MGVQGLAPRKLFPNHTLEKTEENGLEAGDKLTVK